MRTDLLVRTLLVAIWIAALLHVGDGTRTVLLVPALLLVWAVPLIRLRLSRQ